MQDYFNQHYVPQYYFRLFTEGQKFIHMLFKKESRIILNASIKKQCAKNYFYGNRKIEEMFSGSEAFHSMTNRSLLQIAWDEFSGPIDIDAIAPDFSRIWEVVTFQRARTMLQLKKETPAMEALMLEYFKNDLENREDAEDHKEVIRQIIEGNIRIIESPQHALARSISVTVEAARLLSDLDFYILRNHTDYPFVFSDSPVVFYNTYYQNVKIRGVLGAQTPGLQVFYPLDSFTLLVLFDNQIYNGRYKDNLCVNVIERSDVSQLNALQLHHSDKAIYFADEHDRNYVEDLWNAHKTKIIEPKLDFGERIGWLVDGKPVDGTLFHMYEPQLNMKLDLSFVECTPIKESEYKPRKRNPELVAEVERTRSN